MRTINTMYYQSKVLNYTFIRWISYLMIESIFILIDKDHRKFLSNNYINIYKNKIRDFKFK